MILGSALSPNQGYAPWPPRPVAVSVAWMRPLESATRSRPLCSPMMTKSAVTPSLDLVPRAVAAADLLVGHQLQAQRVPEPRRELPEDRRQEERSDLHVLATAGEETIALAAGLELLAPAGTTSRCPLRRTRKCGRVGPR